jgi:hypothetical protein
MRPSQHSHAASRPSGLLETELPIIEALSRAPNAMMFKSRLADIVFRQQQPVPKGAASSVCHCYVNPNARMLRLPIWG